MGQDGSGMTETTAEHEARHAVAVMVLFHRPPLFVEVRQDDSGLCWSEDSTYSPGEVPLWRESPAAAVRLREHGLRCAATLLAPARPSGPDLLQAVRIASDLLEHDHDRGSFLDEAQALATTALAGQDAAVQLVAAELERRMRLDDTQLAVLLSG
jgi:hypothetical protein